MDSVGEDGITGKESSHFYSNIYLVPVVLCILLFSRFSFAKDDCEFISGEAAGGSEYTYEIAEIKNNIQVYFYSAPAYECRLSTFIVKGDKVEILRRSKAYINNGLSKENAFIYIRYRDKNGLFATGWILSDNLFYLKKTLLLNLVCEEWAYKNMSYRAYTASEKKNKYIVNEKDRHVFFMPCQIISAEVIQFSLLKEMLFLHRKNQTMILLKLYITQEIMILFAVG